MNADQLHAALLAKINGSVQFEVVSPGEESGPGSKTLLGLWLALRAVVELHAPELFGGFIACLACSPGMPPPTLVLWKNCASIRAVASALGVEGLES